ncbi:GNAT family N-acetyltransferase [Solimonas variicoloris]|uniref:GNAT family N-acetyltransferase n=1 Tax=Solimonas variicoloris TaxID=254408 RepID=UPI000365E2EB|nr:GNAT family N-acetyltransferase [Solimonas variicoloris]
MKPRLRRARAGDVDGMLDLERHFPGDRMSRASVRRFLRVPSARVWVVDAPPHGLVGALILLMRRNSTTARLYSVVVDPRARGLGLGRRLVQAAERGARAAGCDAVSLEVREDNAAARALYARLGYVERQRLPGYYDDGGNGLRLRKALTSRRAR